MALKRNWRDHPELVRLRENRKCKVSAEEIAEVKAWIAEQKKVEPVVRVIECVVDLVVEDKPFKPGMTIRLDRPVVLRL